MHPSLTLQSAFLVLMLASVLVFAMPALPASAHTDLVGSEPAADSTLREAPDQVTLRFNEPMEPRFAQVALTTPDQEAAQLPVTAGSEPTTLVVKLPDERTVGGAWEVAYRVTSADGHTVQGALSFTVRAPTNAASEDPDASASTEAPTNPGESDESAKAEAADGSTSGDGEQSDDAREADDDAGSWRLAAPVLLGGFVLLLAALFLVTRLARVAHVQSTSDASAETTTADGETVRGAPDTAADADTPEANLEPDPSAPNQPTPDDDQPNRTQ